MELVAVLAAAVPGGKALVRGKQIGRAVESGIYEFVDTTGRTYVGQSSNISARITVHTRRGRLDPRFPVVRTEVAGGRVQREVAEHRRIQEITHNVPARFSDRVGNVRDPIGPRGVLFLTDKFYITDNEEGYGKTLVLTGPWSDMLIDDIRNENISVVRLSRSAGFTAGDVSFVRDLDMIRGIEIYDWNIKDISALSSISGNLEYLGIQCNFVSGPEFSQFNNLKVCKIFWRPEAKGVLTCDSLEILNVVNYPYSDLTTLQRLDCLESLSIMSRKLSCLGISCKWSSLRRLDFADCSRLGTISGIENCDNLTQFTATNCKRICDISALHALNELNILEIIDCGRINSLNSLARSRNLRKLVLAGDTFVEDGDFSKILEVPSLREIVIGDRKHYSHSNDEAHRILRQR